MNMHTHTFLAAIGHPELTTVQDLHLACQLYKNIFSVYFAVSTCCLFRGSLVLCYLFTEAEMSAALSCFYGYIYSEINTNTICLQVYLIRWPLIGLSKCKSGDQEATLLIIWILIDVGCHSVSYVFGLMWVSGVGVIFLVVKQIAENKVPTLFLKWRIFHYYQQRVHVYPKKTSCK